MMVFNWTWEYIDEFMTLPRLKEITDYWQNYPPIHEILAANFVDGKGTQQGGSGEVETMDDLLRMFGSMGGTVNSEIWH